MSSLKEKIVTVYAKYTVWKTRKWSKNPVKTQDKVFKKLISKAKNTRFGKDHSFYQIQKKEDFSKNVPIRDYEEIKTYINRIIDGEINAVSLYTSDAADE